MSQNAAVVIKDIKFVRGGMLPDPLDQWYLHIDLSLATPLSVDN